MHDYKTILRYQAQGLSIRKSAELLSASRNTVSDILKLCETVGMTYEKSLCLTNEEIYNLAIDIATGKITNPCEVGNKISQHVKFFKEPNYEQNNELEKQSEPDDNYKEER